MNIVMMTNTYLPHVGGVARSVASFADAFRRRGHRVLVVAPSFAGAAESEPDVIRLPAIQHFNGSDFSVGLPVPGLVATALDDFRPDVIHSHHPFLLGAAALRTAATRGLPLVFTHHTMYEQYTHYLPGDSPVLKRLAAQLATDYANLCDHVIAPSESIAAVLRERGVTTPITAIPTGIDPARFRDGDGAAARRRYGIPESAFVVGHVGRLAPEKNLGFLARAVAAFLAAEPRGRFLVVGGGPAGDEIKAAFSEHGLADRLHESGPLAGRDLADAYHAMDVFAFASQSETQGMVLAEAMTAGVPVVAVDAPGAREVVRAGVNGRLLGVEDAEGFAAALAWVAGRDAAGRAALRAAARATAEEFSLEHCAGRVLWLYAHLTISRRGEVDNSVWAQTIRTLQAEWDLWSTRAAGVVKTLAAGLGE